MIEKVLYIKYILKIKKSYYGWQKGNKLISLFYIRQLEWYVHAVVALIGTIFIVSSTIM